MPAGGCEKDSLMIVAILASRDDCDERLSGPAILIKQDVNIQELSGCRIWLLSAPFAPTLRVLSMKHLIAELSMTRILMSGDNADDNDDYSGSAATQFGRSGSNVSSVAAATRFLKGNDSQLSAIGAVLAADKPIYLIHGPPGTGKSVTLVQLIMQLEQQERSVLVTAPTNNAVVVLAEKVLHAKRQRDGEHCNLSGMLLFGDPARLGIDASHPLAVLSSVLRTKRLQSVQFRIQDKLRQLGVVCVRMDNEDAGTSTADAKKLTRIIDGLCSAFRAICIDSADSPPESEISDVMRRIYALSELRKRLCDGVPSTMPTTHSSAAAIAYPVQLDSNDSYFTFNYYCNEIY